MVLHRITFQGNLSEVFVMLAMFPTKALLLFGVLFILALGCAWLLDFVADAARIKPCKAFRLHQVHIEDVEGCRCFSREDILPQLKAISLRRLIIPVILVAFAIAILSGTLGPPAWNWQKVILVTLLPIALFIVTTVTAHYLAKHT